MRALFIGGTVDNTEIDLDGSEPPKHYPPDTGSGHARYRLHQVGRHGGKVVYAVYGAPELDDDRVQRIARERDYARRFSAQAESVVA